ncbi:tetracenomycin A2 monooxygenase-dioxygenase [Tamaricihabitans halophyticus]|uniref:Tetracenomycin A2 monooxygenase-dioxygenase n=1 Tax=Tamaricihabitans halophyticus TaxID=1262583 RepID=A0A4R2R428_9PSEU|nr:FAD-dependent monooxygenase [Tamaricihabitans halophyticus]TCP56777.1 tetracenomycin A2 monooxygenase-dioxygenase [Tamaricihabitans halophyticus]
MREQQTSVLIVGGGPVGLTTALFLGRHGIRTILVEKRDGTSTLPRAPGLQARTMELFRGAGIRKEIRELEMDDSHPYFEGGIIKVQSFAEIDDAVTLESPSLDGPTVSPERVMGCGQDRYEKVLSNKAREAGCDIRFHTELTSFEQDADGVTVSLRNRQTGLEETVRSAWLVGADGANSRTRTQLGVPQHGRGTVFNALSIYFRAPELEQLLNGRKFILCYANARGTMMGLSRLHGCDPWLAAPIYHPERGETPEDFTDERCVEIVRAASGAPDMDVRIVAKVPWEGAQRVSESFRTGRVFLAGDAAHVHPPAGGFGANTGIHDAHNLAWKLAAVLHGWGGDALLDMYDTERRRVGSAMAEQAMVRNRIRHGNAEAKDRAEMVDDIIVTLGYRYLSSGIIDPEDSRVLTPKLELSGEPGTRAPHVWLRRGAESVSTVDLFWDTYVLLTVSGEDWINAAHQAAKELGVPVRTYRIGQHGDLVDVDRDWATANSIKPEGAVLVRPDGFVAWRSVGGPRSGDSLVRVLARAAGRTDHS